MTRTGDGGCRLLGQQPLLLLLQVLQLSLVLLLQLINHLLMGLLHGGEAPLTGGLGQKERAGCSCDFIGDHKEQTFKFHQITCKLEPVSHEQFEPVSTKKGLGGMTGYTLH